MSQSAGNSFLRIATHPAVTIAFAIVGLFAGITAIYRSSNETANREVNVETYLEKINQIQTRETLLESQVAALDAKTDKLDKTLSSLTAQVTAVASQLSAIPAKPSKLKSKKPKER
jgi:hypothetical protein